MDTATRTKAAADAIGSATLTPNEARRKYFGYGPIAGGDSAYMQQQNYGLAALAARDATRPLAMPPAARVPVALQPAPTDDETVDAAV
jgi:phage portal protein BeeE